MLHRKFFLVVLSVFPAMIGSAGPTGVYAPLPQTQAAIIAPKLRFGQGRLFVPCNIRVSGSEILVLDEVAPMTPDDNKIVVFDTAGRWKSEFGRGGQGPGEFGQAHSFEVHGDVISILDSFRQCIQEFAASDKRFLRTVRYGAEQVITTPHDFAVLEGGGYVLAKPRGVRGDKTLLQIGPDGKPLASFLEVLPVYETYEELLAKGSSQEPDRVRKNYVNLGYLESAGRTIYYLSWLRNEILAFDFDGKEIGRHALPLPSLEKTVRIVKENGFSNIERRLNYGLRCAGDRIWVLSRDEAGVSILFEIAGGRVVERLRAKETLQDFAVAGDSLFAVDQDAAEILVYPLPPVR